MNHPKQRPKDHLRRVAARGRTNITLKMRTRLGGDRSWEGLDEQAASQAADDISAKAHYPGISKQAESVDQQWRLQGTPEFGQELALHLENGIIR